MTIVKPGNLTEPSQVEPEKIPIPSLIRQIEPIEKEEIARMGQCVFLSLIGFLVTGWFLSRAFVLTLFLIGGLSETIYQMALSRGMIGPRLPFGRVLYNSAGLAMCLLLMIYLTVRALNFIR